MAAANQLVARPSPVQITMSPPAASSPATAVTAPRTASASGPARAARPDPSSADPGDNLLDSALLRLMGTVLVLPKVRGRRGRRAAQLAPTGGPANPPVPDVLAPVLEASAPQPAAGAAALPDTPDVLAPVFAPRTAGRTVRSLWAGTVLRGGLEKAVSCWVTAEMDRWRQFGRACGCEPDRACPWGRR